MVARVFLADNRFRLQFNRADAVRMVEALASGNLSETELAGVSSPLAMHQRSLH